jgi:hypothetical protein
VVLLRHRLFCTRCSISCSSLEKLNDSWYPCEWCTELGWFGPPPKFRSSDKAESNSQFHEKYICNNLIRMWVSFIEWNRWLGGYQPQIPVLSALCPRLNLLTPSPPNELSGYATDPCFQMACLSFILVWDHACTSITMNTVCCVFMHDNFFATKH